MGRYDVIVSTTNGARLDKGSVVTGSDRVNTILYNGIVKYTYGELASSGGGGQVGWLYRWNTSTSTYDRAFSANDGDWSWWVTPNTNLCDRITVVQCTTDEVELAYEWDNWRYDSGYLGGALGVPYRDWSNTLNYAEGAVNPNYKLIASGRVVKTVVMKRGREGVFVGWHSDPRVGPLDSQIPTRNNETSWGERELGTGGFNVVVFSSAGVEAHHPDWGSDARWGALYPTARHVWLGIDDANYPPYDAANYVALQPAGFPAEQETGPWWVGDLHSMNATTFPWCRYIVLRQRMETVSTQFSSTANGNSFVHFVNEPHDAANVPYRTVVFLGAFPYVSPSLSAEPTAALKAAVANRAHPTDFDLSGQAELAPETTTIAEVRDTMISAVEDASPTVLTNRAFTTHREEVNFRTFCESAPSAALRRFSIRDTFEHDGPFVSSPDYREMHTTLECVVAYPKQGAYRDDSATGRPLLDLQDVVRSDLHVLRTTIGVRGYAALETDGVNAAVIGEDWAVDDGDACIYSVFRLRTMYREDPL